jgi:two-component system, NarL family, nitrate/nitrite response regulator NarL
MGVVVKAAGAAVLRKASEKIHAGEVWLGRAQLATMLQEFTHGTGNPLPTPEEAQSATLSARERAILARVGQGLRNKDVARRLCISEITVRPHLTSIFAQLRLADRLALVIDAARHGLAALTLS